MARDVCLACGAYLVLAEVQYYSRSSRRYADPGTLLVYECPACRQVFQRWMREDRELEEMPAPALSLRTRVAAWHRVSEV